MFNVPVDDYKHWRNQARELLKRHVHPKHVTWQHSGQDSFLFGGDAEFLSIPIVCETPKITPDFLSIAKNVACYRDERRWSLLYSIAWRLLFESSDLLSFTVDNEVSRLLKMQKVIAREKHKMEAFVRFKKVAARVKDDLTGDNDIPESEPEQFVAWFEPEHLIVPAVAPFFVKRFYNMRWSILTPDVCAHWDMDQLTFSPGTTRSPTTEDSLETLWLEYYANIFNPARVKLKAMQAEMPKKYWVNLPEAPLIADLTRNASNRTDLMIKEGVSSPWRKTAKSRFIRSSQKNLRSHHDK